MKDSPDNTLAETVHQARIGDSQAVGELLEEHLPRLEAFVRARAGSLLIERESIHDLVQSVCREALQDLDDFVYRGDRQFRNWLFLLATRKIVDRHRFHRQARRDVGRETPIQSDVPPETLLAGYASLITPSRIASAKEQRREIEAIVQRLPDSQQEAVAYSKLLGLSYRDIAARMESSEAAVRNLVFRGLARIAEEIAAGEE